MGQRVGNYGDVAIGNRRTKKRKEKKRKEKKRNLHTMSTKEDASNTHNGIN